MSSGNWARVARRVRVPLGFAFALVYLWLAHPNWTSIAFGAIFVAAGLLLRAVASGHVSKNEALAMSGPYAYTRNPLYLGSLLMGIGFAAAGRSWIVGMLLVTMFFAIYIPVIRGEEEFLREKFPEFDEYMLQVPRMFPGFRRRGQHREAAQFSAALYWKHREYNAAIGAIAMVFILIMKMIWLHGS